MHKQQLMKASVISVVQELQMFAIIRERCILAMMTAMLIVAMTAGMREGATRLESEISTRLSRVGTVELYSNIAMMFMDAMVFTKTKTYMMNSVSF